MLDTSHQMLTLIPHYFVSELYKLTGEVLGEGAYASEIGRAHV
jgi:hypothetical protein